MITPAGAMAACIRGFFREFKLAANSDTDTDFAIHLELARRYLELVSRIEAASTNNVSD